ncbi:MAG: GntR family transcriptional regulator, partial [Hafniaceae bacterium]|nr:GntR family transcriptional regulator [Hafniaceae bacterium]
MNKTELSKTDRIIAEIGQQIISGKYVPGSSLPSEAEMCEEFQTSRNIIREVLRAL